MTTTTAQSPSWRSPDNLIFASLCLFAFSVLFSVTVVQAALFLAIIALLVKRHREKTLSDILPSLTGHPLFVPWMIYLGICLLTAITAYYPAKGFGQLNSDFLKYVCLSTLLLAVKKEHLSRLAAVYTAAALAAALVGIGEVVAAIATTGEYIRANGFMNAVRYGEVMGLAFLLILSRLVLNAASGFRHELLLYKLAVLPVFIAVILSQTRGAYVGLATGIVVMLYFASPSRKKVMRYAAALLVMAGLVLITNPAVRDRFSSAPAKTESSEAVYSSVNIRLQLWKLGLKMIVAHPVLGVGPDNVKKVFSDFQPEQIAYEKTWGSLHNLYIHQAAERGITGLGALVFLFFAMFLFALNRFKSARSPYTLWALCALPAYYAMNMTEITFQHVHTAFAIFMALAMAAAAEKETV